MHITNILPPRAASQHHLKDRNRYLLMRKRCLFSRRGATSPPSSQKFSLCVNKVQQSINSALAAAAAAATAVPTSSDKRINWKRLAEMKHHPKLGPSLIGRFQVFIGLNFPRAIESRRRRRLVSFWQIS